jgi:hypothetical protein
VGKGEHFGVTDAIGVQATLDYDARLAAQVARVRKSEILGRSDPLHRVFDYLVSRAGTDAVPKEFEIAQEALGKDGSFDLAQDASIRVYIHRLRKKLEEFYAQAAATEDRLSIPRGSYRLVLQMGDVLAAGDPDPQPTPERAPQDRPPARRRPPVTASPATLRVRARWVRRLGMAVVLVVGLCLAAAGAYLATLKRGYPTALAASAVWRPFADPALPSTIVIGNQPLAGGHPHVVSMGSAVALARIAPLLDAMARHDGHGPAVVNAAYMPPDELRDSNIIYIGTLAQVGVLTDVVFAHSGFVPPAQVPDQPTLLTDRRTGHVYQSMPPPYVDHRQLTSYGYLACLQGSAGNRILVISGATDGALIQMAEIASDPAQIQDLAARGGAAFEALFAVETLDSVNVGHRLELVRPIHP